MWIIRFHLLRPKQYNKITRICKKHGFITKHHSPVVYAKAALKHEVQKTSWRTLKNEFGIDHISLYKFHENAKSSGLLEEIFHVFLDSRVALYLGDKKSIDTQTLDNSQEIYNLTQKRFESMLQGL